MAFLYARFYLEGRIAQKRFAVDRVVARVLDPARASWYAEQGLNTVCPTKTAIELLTAAVFGPDEEAAA